MKQRAAQRAAVEFENHPKSIAEGARTFPSLTELATARSVAIGIAGTIALFFVLSSAIASLRLHSILPETAGWIEGMYACATLISAFVLITFPEPETRRHARWIAAGLIVSGLGAVAFGLAVHTWTIGLSTKALLYEAHLLPIVVSAVFLVALSPLRETVKDRVGVGIVALGVVAMAATPLGAKRLPSLIHGSITDGASSTAGVTFHALTGWHWVLSVPPALAGIALIIITSRTLSTDPFRPWLLNAFVLYTAAQLYLALWPSKYSPVVTPGNVALELFALVIVVGGIVELRRTIARTARLLENEREQAQRMSELGVLKANFTAMVAHELGSPLAAIRGFASMLGTGELTQDEQRGVLAAIQNEAEVLHALARDVQLSATVERDDFAVQLDEIELRKVMEDATAFGATLKGDHPLIAADIPEIRVIADRWRIGQVMRNLLSNAAKYSPEGTPIYLEAEVVESTVRIKVTDCGFGITPEDIERVFEKFGRGRDRSGRKVEGMGLGLYLSRRIVLAHGSDLNVASTPSVGSVFGFSLEVVP